MVTRKGHVIARTITQKEVQIVKTEKKETFVQVGCHNRRKLHKSFIKILEALIPCEKRSMRKEERNSLLTDNSKRERGRERELPLNYTSMLTK